MIWVGSILRRAEDVYIQKRNYEYVEKVGKEPCKCNRDAEQFANGFFLIM